MISESLSLKGGSLRSCSALRRSSCSSALSVPTVPSVSGESGRTLPLVVLRPEGVVVPRSAPVGVSAPCSRDLRYWSINAWRSSSGRSCRICSCSSVNSGVDSARRRLRARQGRDCHRAKQHRDYAEPTSFAHAPHQNSLTHCPITRHSSSFDDSELTSRLSKPAPATSRPPSRSRR